MSPNGHQLALRFPPRRRCTLAEFEAGANRELLHRLQPPKPAAAFSCIWIVGEPGTGKSHLLQAACTAVNDAGGAAAYLPADVAVAGPEVFDGLDRMDRVAIDDITAWLGTRPLEAALLALYQSLWAAQCSLVVASRDAPPMAEFALADLASRMRAAQTHRIELLDDAARARLLARAAALRGMTLGEDVATYLLRRAHRGTPELLALLDRLDSAALSRKRRLTVALAREVFEGSAS